MRKFDPWPVFFKREWNRNWPFIVGFATTGAIITKYSLSLTLNSYIFCSTTVDAKEPTVLMGTLVA